MELEKNDRRPLSFSVGGGLLTRLVDEEVLDVNDLLLENKPPIPEAKPFFARPSLGDTEPGGGDGNGSALRTLSSISNIDASLLPSLLNINLIVAASIDLVVAKCFGVSPASF